MKIFISYRRADIEFVTPLHTLLLHWFDEGEVFFDQESISPGEPFDAEIAKRIGASRVFLAVIGPRWGGDDTLRRLEEEGDPVRREIRCALENAHANGGKPPFMIPVLVGGCAMPLEERLPADIRAVAKANAVPLGGRYYRLEFQKLLDALQKECGGGTSLRYRQPEGGTQPFEAGGLRLSPYFSDPAGELAKLYDALQEQGGATVTAAATVRGMGGVGKTQLALKYSHAFRDQYAGVWWFRAEDSTLLEQDCIVFRDHQKISAIPGEPAHRAVARWLAGQPRWLLVYDNAEDARQLAPYLPTGKHHVIVTSRNPDWDQAVVELGAWSEDEALEFLRKRLPGADDASRRDLANALGGLPLALEQAAAYILKTGLDVPTYLGALRDWDKRTRLLDRNETSNYPRSVLATLSLAFDRLTDPAKQLLGFCAWLAPEPIPERLFTENVETLPQGLGQRAADALEWRETVAELTGYALCQIVDIPNLDAPQEEGLKEKALLFHRLTQEAVRARPAEERAGLAGAIVLLRAAFPAEANNPKKWPTQATLLPHVQGLERFIALDGFDSVRYSWLLDRAAGYLQYGPALYPEARRIYEQSLELRSQLLGEEHPSALASMGNLAGLLWAQGDLPGARALQERVLELTRRALGEEHPHTLDSMNNLAGLLWAQRDVPGARAVQEKAVELSVRVRGEKHPDTLTSMNNLAVMLWEQGDIRGARTLQEKVLQVRRHVRGEEHPDTLASMYNLAITLQALGDLNGARALAERVLEIGRRVLGEEHPDTFMFAFNLLIALREAGDGKRALDVFRNHLVSLMERDPAGLRADLQNIQKQLRQWREEDAIAEGNQAKERTP